VGFNRIYLVGFMGAGKSTVGRCLAKKLGWNYIDLDEEIERREGRPIAEIFRVEGEPHFRELERTCLKHLSSLRKAVIALGGGAFIDPDNRALAEKTGLTVWLKASFPSLLRRVRMDGTRPNFMDKARAENLYETREPFYALARFHVSTDDRSPDAAADEIIEVVRKL